MLRPTALLQAQVAYDSGHIELSELRQIEDHAILEVLRVQQEAGMDVVTDGEFRREAFMTILADAVEGFAPSQESFPMRWYGPGETTGPTRVRVVNNRLRPTRRLTSHETLFLKQHSVMPFKITLPSPTFIAPGAFKPGVTDRYYPTHDALLEDLVGIVNSEIASAIDEGVTYIQMDAPHYTRYCDTNQRSQLLRSNIDPDEAMAKDIAADNKCLEGTKHEGIIRAVHMCRGNSRSRWRSEGGYDSVAEVLFGSLQADRFLLEYDTDRAGGFEPLRHIPKDKQVVLGLVTTKSGVLESQDSLLRRIDDASKYIASENLAVSPQCGFASEKDGNLLTWDEQRRKLELVADTALKAWG